MFIHINIFVNQSKSKVESVNLKSKGARNTAHRKVRKCFVFNQVSRNLTVTKLPVYRSFVIGGSWPMNFPDGILIYGRDPALFALLWILIRKRPICPRPYSLTVFIDRNSSTVVAVSFCNATYLRGNVATIVTSPNAPRCFWLT